MDMIWIVIRSFVKWTIIIWTVIFALSAMASANEENPAVKKTSSEICHSEQSSYYNRIKNYTAYETIEECLASSENARLPQN